MICSSCGAYFRQSPYNNSTICDVCYNHADELFPDDEEVRQEVENVMHKDGSYRVMPVFYND